ncbi:MAG: 2-succinyl-5-enolpyruvyl-6-hydroxy-3-cyclohexene-1-carboxylic-acid synthase, partial [Deltaproteobacteria bacterium]
MAGNPVQDEKLFIIMENLLLTQNLGRLWASLITAELVKGGCKNFFLSPGLRNAPLIAAIENHPQAKIMVGIDERAQGFRALGFSKSTGEAAVLVCTSGTAMANYFPAVIEAYKSQTPLVILSADRPHDLVYSGDNQAMNQNNLYGEFVLGCLNPGTPNLEVEPSFITTSIANLLNKARFPAKGPVHLNCPFREPLDQEKRYIPQQYLDKSYLALRNETKFINPSLAPDDLNTFVEEFLQLKSALLVVGPTEAGSNNEEICNLIKKWTWPFFLDVCSGLKYGFNISDGAMPGLDHPEVLKKLSENPPEMIIHLGGRLVSKHYYTFLKEHPRIRLVTVNNQMGKEDPAHRVGLRFNCHPNQWAEKFAAMLPENELPYEFDWSALAQKKMDIIDEGPLTYPKISKSLINWIPEGQTLYLGNSTVIRSFDSYLSLNERKDLKIIHHRGASGIEGFIAGSCGAEGPVTLVLGDVSFLHDLSSLMLLKDEDNPPIILVVNNNGGGIFSLLPIAKEEKIIPYMLTPHDLTFHQMAEQFGLEYNLVESIDELKTCY